MSGAQGAADRGLWVAWYDLEEGHRGSHLRWLHDTYLPQLLKRPGILWAAHYASVEKSARRGSNRESRINRTNDAAVPTGSQYIFLAAAADPHVFGNPTPGEYHAGLPAESRRQLALRAGERANILAEAGRTDGPAAASLGEKLALAPCIQLGSFNCAPEHEEEMLAWYTKWRLPAMAATPGCVRFRTLASVSGWAKHAVLYEFVSLEARNTHFMGHEDQHPEMKAWSDRMVPRLTHAPGSATVAVRTWPPG
jgi:hypothetical protein